MVRWGTTRADDLLFHASSTPAACAVYPKPKWRLRDIGSSARDASKLGRCSGGSTVDVAKALLRLACPTAPVHESLWCLIRRRTLYCRFANEQENVKLKEKNGRPSYLGLQAGDVSIHRLHIQMHLLVCHERTRPLHVLEWF